MFLKFKNSTLISKKKIFYQKKLLILVMHGTLLKLLQYTFLKMYNLILEI